MEQPILCIKSDLLFQHGKWQGLQTADLDHFYQLLLTQSEFRPRHLLENDPNYKQIIPQVILRYQDKYFLHRQVSAKETRLNSLCPLPLGGHVEEFDRHPQQDIIETALNREVAEEVTISANITRRQFLGLVYIEDGNLVNHMHVGVFYLFELDNSNVTMNETGFESLGFVSYAYLQDHREDLTYWSRIIIDHLS